MIHYALRCADAHEFDGWFKSSASFDAQAAGGLLACPACGSTAVRRGLMAPRIGQGGAARPPVQSETAKAEAPAADTAASAMPDRMRAALQRMRAEVEKSCAYVGPDFAREARRMAEPGEERRPIYGEATDDEAAALEQDGIKVSRIPWVPRADG